MGASAQIYSSWSALESITTDHLPELVFIENTGVFVRPEFNQAKAVQLRCYYDVISRVAADANLDPLSQSAIDELLNWDAEKLRQQMAQK